MRHSSDPSQLLEEYTIVRHYTEKLCKPLLTEDYVIQSIEDVSPPKWHLAHTTWFFETFILVPYANRYELFNTLFPYLFNSYYQALGNPYPRVRRGVLSRPNVEAVYHYRHHVDAWMQKLLMELNENSFAAVASLIRLGLNHEQQHQELLLTDIKYNFSLDPSQPCYQDLHSAKDAIHTKLEFIPNDGGLIDIGHADSGFCFDNELPRHKVFLAPYKIASRLITNEEYLRFIEAGGYREPKWWLADGWDCLQKNAWEAPLYWHDVDKEWFVFTLHGFKKLNPQEPVSHISFYEADAYARFQNARLASEAEWEHYAQHQRNKVSGNFLEEENYHPLPSYNDSHQLFGDVWEWTSSAYAPYPGYQSLSGALGEYNGKFMSNQMVLRGGSCITPQSHIRGSYRNFFQPDKRWQFTGIRLAKNI